MVGLRVITEPDVEPNHFARAVRSFELAFDARLTRHRLYYEGALHDRPNVRPWSLHRTGYAGAQRYGGCWR